ncbi:unnamed protein product [Caenorhabditis auriculariae]|uniref:Thioesterase domain-containing protein n=1 Tax=Caenorhabditis auriculariae TaxID=2777116 RepID=A0A8S1GY67_9PELO|nr:unnamed protein product [Caenorhabditis auriculariae]
MDHERMQFWEGSTKLKKAVDDLERLDDTRQKVEAPSTELDDVIYEFQHLAEVDNFNRVGADVVPKFASKEKIVCEMVLQPHHLNSKGTLHGGQTATLTDIITARAVGVSVKDQGMASVELAVSYMLPVKAGDTLQITATVLKIGRNIAFTECEFRRKSDGKLAAKGKHTLAFLPGQPAVSVNGKLQQSPPTLCAQSFVSGSPITVRSFCLCAHSNLTFSRTMAVLCVEKGLRVWKSDESATGALFERSAATRYNPSLVCLFNYFNGTEEAELCEKRWATPRRLIKAAPGTTRQGI